MGEETRKTGSQFLPVRNAPDLCHDNEGEGPWKNVTVKRVFLALSQRGTINLSEWGSGAHDWVM